MCGRAILMLVVAAVLRAQSELPARVTLGGRDFPYFYDDPRTSDGPLPLLVLLPSNPSQDAARASYARWQPRTAARNWRIVTPSFENAAPPWSDGAVKIVEAVIESAARRFKVDATQVYLAGEGDGASGVFYLLSRAPHLWSAAFAVDGTPKPAIDTNRLFAANASLVPLLWITPPDQRVALELPRAKLAGAGFSLTVREAAGFDPPQVLDWLAGHRRDPFPAKIDCETGSPAFARCYWIEMTKFDPARRNDVLASTRVAPGSGAFLDLGGFGYKITAPGPGVLVAWLPDNYAGPLRIDDRIVSVGGQDVKDAADYVRLMDEMREEKPTAVMVHRGKNRQRVETRVKLPKREENVTARLQAEWQIESRELTVISRAVTEMRLRLPPQWAPATVNWNGQASVRLELAGCWLLSEGAPAPRPCGD